MALKKPLWKHNPPWRGLSGDYDKRQCRCFFFDSGAHSLYNKHVKGKDKKNKNTYKWYTTQEFYDYMDNYAEFIKQHKDSIDYYATVDVIYNPEMSWESLKYLENKHGLKPVPVIHCKTELSWLEKHLEAGYKYIGIGGLGQESTRFTYTQWADRIFDRIADPRTRKPTVKIHGFAMTSLELLFRYPWYSVDSASWTKASGFGTVFVPKYRNGSFVFNEKPNIVCFSYLDSKLKQKGKHYYTLSQKEKEIVLLWIKEIGLTLGDVEKDVVKKHGLLTHFGPRAVANLYYFERMAKALPKWPWAFNIYPSTNRFR